MSNKIRRFQPPTIAEVIHRLEPGGEWLELPFNEFLFFHPQKGWLQVGLEIRSYPFNDSDYEVIGFVRTLSMKGACAVVKRCLEKRPQPKIVPIPQEWRGELGV